MTATVRLPAAMRDAIVAHARAGLPNEACGLIGGTAPASAGGCPTTWHPARNRFASSLRFEVHPDDLLRTILALDEAGAVIWGVVHSHVRSAAAPSPTDIARAGFDAVHVIVSLDPRREEAGAPPIRAWRIADGTATEAALAFE